MAVSMYKITYGGARGQYEDGSEDAVVFEMGTEEEVAEWLKQQTKHSLNLEDYRAHTPLDYALISKESHILKAFLADPRVEIRKTEQFDGVFQPTLLDWTILHEATQHGDTEKVKVIIDSGRVELDSVAVKNPGRPNEKRWTPLSVATHFGYIEIIHLLCNAGVDPSPYLKK